MKEGLIITIHCVSMANPLQQAPWKNTHYGYGKSTVTRAVENEKKLVSGSHFLCYRLHPFRNESSSSPCLVILHALASRTNLSFTCCTLFSTITISTSMKEGIIITIHRKHGKFTATSIVEKHAIWLWKIHCDKSRGKGEEIGVRKPLPVLPTPSLQNDSSSSPCPVITCFGCEN
jgi:hypothetical protein